jgi:WD40 repeat protein
MKLANSMRPLLIGPICFTLFVCAAVCDWHSSLHGQDAKDAESISFHKDIRPIFQAHCIGCHQPAKTSGQYDMTNVEKLFGGGQSGEKAIVPNLPDNSYLLDLIEPIDGSADMPLDKEPLSEADRALIRKWIEQGAIIDQSPLTTRVINASNPPTYRSPPVVTSLDVSPDGKLIAVSGYHEVLLHKTEGGEPQRLVGISERIEKVCFSPDGKQLAVAGGSPGRFGEVQVWNVASGALSISEVIGSDTLYGVSWSSDGKRIAFGCPDTNVRAIDSTSGKQLLFNGAHDDWILDTVFSKDNTYLISVSRDRSMKLVNFETQRFIDNITSITPGALKGGLNSVDRHPGKDELLAGGADGVPKLYQMLRTQARKIGDDFNLIRSYEGLAGRVNDVRFSPDGNVIAAVSSDDGDGHLKTFETESGKVLSSVTVPKCGLYCVAFIPDSPHLCTAGFDGRLYIYDVTTGKLIKSFVAVPIDPGNGTSQNHPLP